MAAPFKTVDKIVEIIREFVPKDNVPKLLMSLEKTLTDSKNQSFNETIRRIVESFK